MIKNLKKSAAILSAGLMMASVAHAQPAAQSYPNQQIRIVVPYAPGGINDTMARVVGQKLQDAWGQPVIVDNRPGGEHVFTKVRVPGEDEIDLDTEVVKGAGMDWSSLTVTA